MTRSDKRTADVGKVRIGGYSPSFASADKRPDNRRIGGFAVKKEIRDPAKVRIGGYSPSF